MTSENQNANPIATSSALNHGTHLQLPNGVAVNYSFDTVSQLTGVTYMLGSNTLGSLTYAYDLSGRRMGVGGSYARTGVPLAASASTYNVNNQLANWQGTTLTYDLNGNLTSDGTNTYTWNARNQLVSISGGVSASFQYDPFGRRVSKTVGGMTQFLYDGVNPVQELTGTSAPANLLTGGVDEYFQRTDSAGARNFLTDALGSTLALTDSSGATQTSYTFEPFGNTTTSGSTTTNSFAFTGRELDSTGLYFYRARYYHPQLQRLVSEDPLGASGGMNLYSYSFNSPSNFRDPSGLKWEDAWNNPIMDFISSHADSLPGICQGGAFQYGGLGGQAGTLSGGVYAFDNVSISYKGPNPHLDYHLDPPATLYEGSVDLKGGEIGYGRVYGRKGLEDQFLFVGAGRGPFHLGPLVGKTADGNYIIGSFGDFTLRPEGLQLPGEGGGLNGTAGGGWYLIVQSAASCVQ